MKFKVTRTSLYASNEQPIKESFKEDCFYTDVRTLKTEEEYNVKFRDKWRDKGTNHRIINSKIARDFPDVGYFIEIETIEKMVELVKKYGDIVLTINGETLEVEIYDGYRE